MSKKKLIGLFVLALVVILGYIVFNMREEEEVVVLDRRKLDFADWMGLWMDSGIGVLEWFPPEEGRRGAMVVGLDLRNYENPLGFEGIVFIHTEEEMADHPDSMMVAFPSQETYRVIEEINKRVADVGWPSINVEIIESFGLNYPLTVENVIDDWEKMYEFYSSLDRLPRSLIRSITRSSPRVEPRDGVSSTPVENEE